MPSELSETIMDTLVSYGQEHLLQYWPRLTSEQKVSLLSDIQSTDFEGLKNAMEETMQRDQQSKKLDALLEPIPDNLHEGVTTCNHQQLKEYMAEGLRQISENKVAVLLLAGGQGTRLGVHYPKGMYDIGLPSQKTLYQLQAERLLKLQELAYEFTGASCCIPWYIMTSEHTMEATSEYFRRHKYFGLKRENLIVFEQFMLPCLTFDGKIIMEDIWKISKAPDGNGGLFRALQERGILDEMAIRNIEYVHVYCVDNILVKMADPIFTGYCVQKGVDCAAKVVEKNSPSESVGVVCSVGGKFQVVEYSEISPESAQKKNPDGRLTLRAGNICNHFFTMSFLRQIGSGSNRLRYHIAKKKIPYLDSHGNLLKPIKPNGIKLEKFVFDVFMFSKQFAVWEVKREHEFAPLKNADNSEKDTPTTTREALYSLHRHFIEEAGGKFNEDLKMEDSIINTSGDKVVEISPLVSYGGEGLEDLVRGKIFEFPLMMTSSEEMSCKLPNSKIQS